MALMYFKSNVCGIKCTNNYIKGHIGLTQLHQKDATLAYFSNLPPNLLRGLGKPPFAMVFQAVQ